MLSLKNNLKELPQVGVTSLHRSVGSAASMRGDNFIMEEIWKPTYQFGDIYEISNLGRIRSWYCYSHGETKKRKDPRYLKPYKTKQGYLCVKLGHKIYPQPHFTIHRLKAVAFIPNPYNLPCINHKDGDKLNNAIDNLEWCTYKHNLDHAREIGLLVNARGEKQAASKLSKKQVISIYKSTKGTRELSRKYGVNHTTISAIKTHKNWRWLTENIK